MDVIPALMQFASPLLKALDLWKRYMEWEEATALAKPEDARYRVR
jgi:hypothetical protein